MAIEFVLLLLGAYLLGSVPAAYLAARWSRGIDIRQYGSGNVGATNLLGLTSKWIAIVVIIFFALAAIFLFTIHSIPLGTGVGVTAMPLVSWVADEPLPMTLGFLAIFLLMVIRRLTAPKTSVTASVSSGELVLNRLLFDRDIRDKEAWIHRQPIEQAEKRGKE